jgi:hypothetical protein
LLVSQSKLLGARASPEEHRMDTTFRAALGRQVGAAIDMLENAVVGCSDELWTQRLWRNPPDEPRRAREPAEFAEFWFLAYHALLWRDLYRSGCREEDFPPASFARVGIDDAPPLVRRHTRQALPAYHAALRRKRHATRESLRTERARQAVDSP